MFLNFSYVINENEDKKTVRTVSNNKQIKARCNFINSAS